MHLSAYHFSSPMSNFFIFAIITTDFMGTKITIFGYNSKKEKKKFGGL